ncbi:MAG: YbgC/FadM family acyl-CoA thioesterase [Campylobacterales bacterium]|nr:YbgC/FadM family acyl-CoA thioesterase [Campylobacterales bacterium]
MRFRIYYDDTDAGGIVYHANYLKFCERARSELFFARGSSPAIDGGHFVVKHIDADFIKPAKLGDMLEVSHEILKLGGASLELKQEIWKDEEKLFSMTSTLVFVKNGKPARFSQESAAIMKEMFGGV